MAYPLIRPARTHQAPQILLVVRLANDIQWTTDLGNAFLAQQAEVMDAVQRMRKKAQDKGDKKTPDKDDKKAADKGEECLLKVEGTLTNAEGIQKGEVAKVTAAGRGVRHDELPLDNQVIAFPEG